MTKVIFCVAPKIDGGQKQKLGETAKRLLLLLPLLLLLHKRRTGDTHKFELLANGRASGDARLLSPTARAKTGRPSRDDILAREMEEEEEEMEKERNEEKSLHVRPRIIPLIKVQRNKYGKI